MFEETTYTVTEGVDEYVEIKIQSKNIKNIVVVNISLTSDSAKSKCKLKIQIALFACTLLLLSFSSCTLQ